MKKIILLLQGVLFLSASIPFLCSCGSTSVVTIENPDVMVAQGQVAIVHPQLQYFSIENEKVLDPEGFQAEATKEFLANEASQLMERKGLQLVNQDQLSLEIIAQVDNLAKPVLSQELSTLLYNWGKTLDFPYVLALFTLVKVGGKGSWNPYSGAITSNNSYTRIKGVLINTKTSKKVWQNEIQLRAIPEAGKTNFIKSIETLFNNLKTINYEKANN